MYKITRKFLPIFVIFTLLMIGCMGTESPPPKPTSTPEDAAMKEGWELVWEDDFEDTYLDTENWIFETGAGGWGNAELQHYTTRPKNVRVDDGHLVIEAHKEDYLGSDYTSARIKTQTLHSWTYGRIEARIKLPTGQGIWPAFWMLGEDFPTAGWPDCGEIDIMENIGEPHTVYGTVHGPGYSGGGGIGQSFTVPGDPVYEDFHTYAIEWAPGEIRWFVDDVNYNTITDTDVPGEWVYDHPFFIILNLAVGGEWPGYPDQTTEFPQQLIVDYVRVYRDPTFSLEDLQTDTLHVSDLVMNIEEKDEKWEGQAMVTVVDSSGNPVEGVEVKGGWVGVVTGATERSITDSDGIAGPFTGRKTSFADDFTFCVTNLSKTLYSYDKNQNMQTCITKTP